MWGKGRERRREKKRDRQRPACLFGGTAGRKSRSGQSLSPKGTFCAFVQSQGTAYLSCTLPDPRGRDRCAWMITDFIVKNKHYCEFQMSNRISSEILLPFALPRHKGSVGDD